MVAVGSGFEGGDIDMQPKLYFSETVVESNLFLFTINNEYEHGLFIISLLLFQV